jgi:CRISPR type I-E-associated protein CasB/Cse2
MSTFDPVTARPEPRSAREVVHAIAREIADERIPPGDRAALRRENLGPAFWRVAVRHLEPGDLLGSEDASWRADAERRWSAILAELARASGQHLKGRRLGAALAEAGVAEARVLRLARAHGESLLKTVRAVAHQLVSGGQHADWADFAALILSDGRTWEDDERRRLCLDYYRARERGSHDVNKEES